ncbi:hypothetical protein [Polluticaenibacter yanchengensis]|uniref:Peptidase M23 n=1 Tax=Polluticaenibacter yanchengensis TaxID=3014562 RepID=A0ABT4UKT6_9BACT|nr:hypothetical protein [Chitinophagaceae bacterium LY-5]
MKPTNSQNTFKRLKNRYRLVIINDDTFEELTTFKLNRVSVFVLLSSIFVILVGFTLAIVSFTNIRYLIPGYGKQGSTQMLRDLKMKTDSLEYSLAQKQLYLDAVQRVLKGDTNELVVDTTLLDISANDSLMIDTTRD